MSREPYHTITYRLPEKPALVADIVAAIPNNWSWFDGGLLATQALYDSGRIAPHTRLRLSRFHSINPTIESNWTTPFEESRNSGELLDELKPSFLSALTSMIFNNKLPSALTLDEAGYNSRELHFSDAKNIIVTCMKIGYKGRISAFSDCYDNSKYDNPERAQINHHEGIVEVQWNKGFGGKRENLESILAVCTRQGLLPKHNQPAFEEN